MSSNALVPFNNLNRKIEKLQDEQDQPWFKRAHLGKHLNMKGIVGYQFHLLFIRIYRC